MFLIPVVRHVLCYRGWAKQEYDMFSNLVEGKGLTRHMSNWKAYLICVYSYNVKFRISNLWSCVVSIQCFLNFVMCRSHVGSEIPGPDSQRAAVSTWELRCRSFPVVPELRGPHLAERCSTDNPEKQVVTLPRWLWGHRPSQEQHWLSHIPWLLSGSPGASYSDLGQVLALLHPTACLCSIYMVLNT